MKYNQISSSLSVSGDNSSVTNRIDPIQKY